jgi:hypothetical protein
MKKPKPSRDPNVTAFRTLEAITGAQSGPIAPEFSGALDNAEMRRQIMREMGRRGGQKGGKARAETLSSKKRREIAKKAAQARWSREQR